MEAESRGWVWFRVEGLEVRRAVIGFHAAGMLQGAYWAAQEPQARDLSRSSYRRTVFPSGSRVETAAL